MEQLLLHFLMIYHHIITAATAPFPKILDLYLKDDELSIVTLIGFPVLFIRESSLLNFHKLPDVSA